MLKNDIRAAEYRERAEAAQRLADASPLALVREQQALAAVTWLNLAASEDERSLRHAQAVARQA